MVDVQTNAAPASEPKSFAVNLSELDKLAKLLATENITVEHKQVDTAYFDTQRRQLILPIWQDLTKELYHMLVLHEVGHALYTNADDWVNTITANKVIKGALNVVEDARIERKMKQRYPGSRRDFREGYKLLMDRDFFQINGQDITRMNLGDRLNLYYKVGEYTAIPFSNFEKIFVRAIDDVDTFQQAVWVAEELAKYITKRELSDEFKQKYGKSEAGDGDDDEEFDDDYDSDGEALGDADDDSDWGDADDDDLDGGWDGDSEWGDEEADEDEGGGSSSSNHEKSEDGNKEQGGDKAQPSRKGSTGGSSGWQNEDTDPIKTVEALEKALQGMRSKAPPTTSFDMVDDLDYKKWVVPYKDILTSIRTNWPESIQGDNYAKMRRRNIKVVDYLAKEFFLRKAADGYQRVREAKTGILNPDKLHGYKIIDDVFRRNTVIAESKNHGIVMYIDFSGSMQHVLGRTIEQLINLVLFCRKVNIPHRVYAFTDNNWSFIQHYISRADALARGIPTGRSGWGTQIAYRQAVDTREVEKTTKSREAYLNAKYGNISGDHVCVPEMEMNLLELFHEGMSARDVSNMAEAMLFCYPLKYNYYELNTAQREEQKPMMFALGGTPLDGCIILSASMLKAFKRETNAQIVSAVYLTDGDSGGYKTLSYYEKKEFVPDPSNALGGYYKTIRQDHRLMRPWSCNAPCTIFRDAKNKRVYRPIRAGHYQYSSTSSFLKWIADHGFHTVGYRLMSISEFRNTSRVMWPMQEAVKLYKDFKANKCVSIDDSFGFDLFNALAMDSIEVTEEEDFKFDVKQDATKNQIAKAFIKARSDRLNMRIVLQNFIKTIAT